MCRSIDNGNVGDLHSMAFAVFRLPDSTNAIISQQAEDMCRYVIDMIISGESRYYHGAFCTMRRFGWACSHYCSDQVKWVLCALNSADIMPTSLTTLMQKVLSPIFIS